MCGMVHTNLWPLVPYHRHKRGDRYYTPRAMCLQCVHPSQIIVPRGLSSIYRNRRSNNNFITTQLTSMVLGCNSRRKDLT